MASIKKRGVIVPIILRKVVDEHTATLELVAGERRLRAAKEAGLKTIPANVMNITEAEALEIRIIENLQREDLHPLEEAEGYETLLKKHGYKTVDDIATKVGKSRSYVYGRMKLCDLVPENRKRFYDGWFSPSVALMVARIPAHLQKEAGDKLLRGESDAPGYRAAKIFLEAHFMLRLKEASFDTKDATLGGKAGSCAECSKRTGNQKELFLDIASADVCTDPACFGMKKNAHVQRTLARAKEAGKKVMSEATSKKVFSSYSDDVSGYVSLNDACWDDAKHRKFRQLVKDAKDADVTYAVHPHKGHLVELLSNAEAKRIREQLGIKGRNLNNSSNTADQAKARREERIRKLAVNKIVDAVIAAARVDKAQTFLRPLAESVKRAACFDAERWFVQRRDPAVKGEAVTKELDEHLKSISDEELLLFCLELRMLAEVVSSYSRYGETPPQLTKLYGIDTQKLIAKAREEVQSKQNKKKAPAKKEKKPTPKKAKAKQGGRK